MDWNFVGSFLIGAVGALVIVWLRWVGTLPRFSSTVEISIIEEEYKALSTVLTNKIKSKEEISGPEVKHSDNLRDDIWRQRTRSFLFSVLLYVVLGGCTASLFVGLEIPNIKDPVIIGKLLSAGALWSSFYSFIDIKKSEDVVEAIREKQDAETLIKLEEHKIAFKEEGRKRLEEAKSFIDELTNKYNDLVDKYEKLKKSTQ